MSSLLHSCALVGLIVSHRLEINMVHGVLGGDSFSMIVSQHLAEQVKSLI